MEMMQPIPTRAKIARAWLDMRTHLTAVLALAGSNLTVRDSRTSDRSAQSRFFFKMEDQAKSLTRGVESWNGNSRFKRHHIERKEVRGFEAICACHFAVKYLKYTIKFLR